MNNKQRGTEFEQEWCDYLARKGYWAHFIEPKQSGAQPFDVIAYKDCEMYAYDCKTLSGNRFALSNFRENQRMAFEMLYERGCMTCALVIKTDDYGVYLIPYQVLMEAISRDLVSIKVTDYEIYRLECYPN
nr:MAG TPA: recombination protein [Bacteriophage sp.]